jgi:hypothetical protein
MLCPGEILGAIYDESNEFIEMEVPTFRSGSGERDPFNASRLKKHGIILFYHLISEPCGAAGDNFAS